MSVTVVEKTVFDYGGKTLISLAEDNNLLCVANKNGMTKILKTNNPEEEPEVIEIVKDLTSIRGSGIANFIITTSKGDAFNYCFTEPKESLIYRSALPLRDSAVVHSGKMCVLGGDDLELTIVDLGSDSDNTKATIKTDEQISQLSYTPKTNILAVSTINGVVSFYSMTSTKPNKVHELPGYIPENAYNATIQDKLLNQVLDEGDDSDSDLDNNLDEEKITDPEFCEENRISTRAAWHPNGLYFALPCKDSTIKIFTINDYSLIKTVSNLSHLNSKFIDLQFDTVHGNYLAAIDLENKLTVWNWQTSQIHYTHQFKQKITNIIWKANASKNDMDIILGTWSGAVLTVQSVAESLNLTEPLASRESSSLKPKSKNGLFVDSDSELENALESRSGENHVNDMAEESNGEENENDNDAADSGTLFSDVNENESKRKYHFDDEEDFIDDDDGAGYVTNAKKLNNATYNDKHSYRRNNAVNFVQDRSSHFHYRPISPGATPFGSTDRRYLTMNTIGYVSTVRNSEQNSITVSFFDIGKFSEYHFEDVFGYDVCYLNEIGTLFAQSKTGQLQYRPHDSTHSNWTKLIPLSKDERITSIAATPKLIIVGTSLGYVRIFNEFAVPLAIEKMSPIVALTAHEYKIFSVHFSQFHGVSYSLFEQTPSASKYYQRECSLPISLPSFSLNIDEEFDTNFEKFNPMGIRSLFFSIYGDPCIFGADGVLLVLNKWRSSLQSRWVPVLDSSMEIWKMAGGKENNDVHVWPLGLSYDTLNCILVKGKHIWPEFPLPLPSEMEIRIPILVKAQLLQEHKERLQKEEDAFHDESDEEQKVEKEIVVPVNMAAEEELLRSKILSTLLTDTLENDGELYGNEQDILASLNGAYDKSLLRLFAVACSEQNAARALSLARELKQDKALTAAAKISERAEMMALMKKVNDIREARFEEQMNNI
ncbi:hypothetical protein KAFR_0A05280 [Kazachstania africana CBS 2517]|uniref:Uncharacterized protein n=1 Tax=Kazachstania africana (strain ATCC 22294 / BCRC 22015 / CBS 2517 / CECT 1963 / NBRC 1671 / NRRL Y-8276) TaxID=1071382 RepID=H2ANL3_KAZAF|nr:hypothetical protein KAFR_0A05280 [Kazachstania africana CBS 2517]CCF55963.1 hypothetical protein KAFR_0A05280 [Kazachstania africana CBS 2517]